MFVDVLNNKIDIPYMSDNQLVKLQADIDCRTREIINRYQGYIADPIVIAGVKYSAQEMLYWLTSYTGCEKYIVVDAYMNYDVLNVVIQKAQ